jgi:hypothetical protein
VRKAQFWLIDGISRKAALIEVPKMVGKIAAAYVF